MITSKAEIDVQDLKFGYTPLHLAVIKDHSEVVALLMQHHAMVELKSSSGLTPKDFAVRYGSESLATNAEIIELLTSKASPGTSRVQPTEQLDAITPSS